MTRQPLLITIAVICCTIVLIILYAFFRRYSRKKRFMRLDRSRDRFNPIVSSMVQCPGEIPTKSLVSRPGSVDWLAIEEALLHYIAHADAELYPRLYKLFESLGYVDHYLSKLGSSRMWERAEAAEHLGTIRCQRAVHALITALEDKTRDVRNMAVYSLGVIGDIRALPAIMDSLKTGIASLEDVSLRIVKSSIISFGADAVTHLRSGLKNDNWRVRCVVVDILGDLEGVDVGEDLSLALLDSEPDVRAKAAKGLGKKKVSAAVNDLMRLTEDPSWVVRLHSTRALGLIGVVNSVDKLKQRLFDENWQVRRAAAEALGLMKDHSLEALRDILLNHEDAYAKEMVVEEMQRTGLVWHVVGGLGDEREDVRKRAEETLYAIGLNGAFSPLINALERGTPEIRSSLIGILGRFKAPRAVDAIKAAAHSDIDIGVRKAARAVLGLH
ncbi:MAG: HEAT repeat domain-containing protein [Thermodesulfobacteriota bacterium]